jgi:hypothetical protein
MWHKVENVEKHGFPTNPPLTSDKLSSCQIQCCCHESTVPRIGSDLAFADYVEMDYLHDVLEVDSDKYF